MEPYASSLKRRGKIMILDHPYRSRCAMSWSFANIAGKDKMEI